MSYTGFRFTGRGAVLSRPADVSPAVDGNTWAVDSAGDTPGTEIDATWLNRVKANLEAAIAWLGGETGAAGDNQLKVALQAKFDTKAAVDHDHEIVDVAGLQDALHGLGAAVDDKQPLSAKLTALADVAPNADRVMIWDESANTFVPATLGAGLAISGTQIRAYETHGFACSDRTTALETSANIGGMRIPYAFTVTGVYASLVTPQTSGALVTVDINEDGTSILSTTLTFDNGDEWSGDATTPAVISDAAIAAGAEISADIDQIGDGTATGLIVYLTGYRP